MTYPFPVEYKNDLSDIPEEYLRQLEASLPSNRYNELSHQPDGSLIVGVYCDNQVRLFDRIKHIDSYLRGIADNYTNGHRNIITLYIIE